MQSINNFSNHYFYISTEVAKSFQKLIVIKSKDRKHNDFKSKQRGII